jgi:hypothetical protein
MTFSHVLQGAHMNKTTMQMLGVAVAVAGFWCASASAMVIAEHTGSNDPAGGSDTTLWSSNGVLAGTPVAGPPAAWQIDDPNNGSLEYIATPSSGDLASATADGWKFSFNLRVNNQNDGDNRGNTVLDQSIWGEYDNAAAGTSYYLSWGSDANGAPIVGVNTIGANSGQMFTLTGADNTQFHLYELVSAPSASKADLYVDGVLRISNIPSLGNSSYTGIYWGSGDSVGTGSADYNLVRLATLPVPEPATLSLLGLGGAMLLRNRRS